MRSGQRMREQKRMYLCKCHSIKKKERKKETSKGFEREWKNGIILSNVRVNKIKG